MPDHTPKEQAREKPDTGTSHGSSHATPNTKAPSNSPSMSTFQKLGGISGRK